MKNVVGEGRSVLTSFSDNCGYSLFYLFFIFGCFWVFVAARGLSLVAVSGGYSSLRCTGFSLRWLLLLRSIGSRDVGSVVVAHGL